MPAGVRGSWPARLVSVPTLINLVCLLISLTAAADILVWMPRTDPIERTDAVIVLGGTNNPDRLSTAESIAAHFGVPLYASSGSTRHWRCTGPDTQLPPGAHCFVPPQFTTQGEARYVQGLVRRYGWRSVTVVVSTEQVNRARLRFSRCHIPGLRITAVPVKYKTWKYATVYEIAAGFKAELLQRSC